jgi:type IV secretory pathway VirB2 component (pilin)
VDPNPLYYPLSTIAQTLAGALAILVAVVLFKLAAFSKAIEEGKNFLLERRADPATAWPILRDKGFEALAQYLETKGKYGDIRPDFNFRRVCEPAHAAYHTWGHINSRLYAALAATVLDIALCFAALPFTPRFARSQGATWSVQALAVGLGIICLLLYVRLIVAMVSRPAD